MKLSQLLGDIGLSYSGNDVEVLCLTDDSRKVKPGYLFVAVRGQEYDGHNYIESAINNGAVAIVCEKKPNIKNKKFIEVKVENSRRALGLLWAAWYGFPARQLKVIGVTGTDGKTTTVNLIYHLLKSTGRRVGMVSTINARIGEREVDTGFHVTSPQPELLQKLLAEMVKENLEYTVLEVTSHGLDQERVAGIKFEGAVITNVTHEHLDYHKTLDEYLKTKGRLFANVQFSVLNHDDRSFDYLSKVATGTKISYGLKGNAEVLGADVYQAGEDSSFVIKVIRGETALRQSPRINFRLPGSYNVLNALAAAAATWQVGLNLEEIKTGLESFRPLVGRFEEIKLGQAARVVVDFAHTPNALNQVLDFCSKVKAFDPSSPPGLAPRSSGRGFEGGKLIVVFGCAGERDKEKRPMMGEVSGRLADVSVLTAEDPRREDLNTIIDEIAQGCRRAGAKEVDRQRAGISRQMGNQFVRIPDRRQAIEFALKIAQKNDLVLVTGKGHEKSMCFGTTELPWSDQAVIQQALEEMFKANGKKT